MPLLTAGPSRFLGGGAKWWQVAGATCIAAYQPKGAADLATSYVNLANPGTYNATWSGASPSWTVGDGWQCSVANYLRTGVVPVDGDWMIARYSNCAAVVYIAGVFNGTYKLQMINGSTTVGYTYGTTDKSKTPALTAGVLAVTKTQAYRNGVSEALAMSESLGAIAIDIWLGARNALGVPHGNGQIYIQAYAHYRPSEQPTAGDIAALTTRMQAL
jgi:hypothetical protein